MDERLGCVGPRIKLLPFKGYPSPSIGETTCNNLGNVLEEGILSLIDDIKDLNDSEFASLEKRLEQILERIDVCSTIASLSRLRRGPLSIRLTMLQGSTSRSSNTVGNDFSPSDLNEQRTVIAL